jgi:hypothetical protein
MRVPHQLQNVYLSLNSLDIRYLDNPVLLQNLYGHFFAR